MPGIRTRRVTVWASWLDEMEADLIEFHIEGLRLAGEPVPPATTHVAIVTVAAYL